MHLKLLPVWMAGFTLLNILLASVAAEEGGPRQTVDISAETHRHVVVAEGTEKVYQGHPTTVLMPDHKTMYCVWTYGHGGRCGPMAVSKDAGRTWTRMDEKLPASWRQASNCPAIYRLKDPSGAGRLFVYAGCDTGAMWASYSEDGGGTWSQMKAIDDRKGPVMPWCTITPVHGGKQLLAMTNIRPTGMKKKWNVVAQSTSSDGGKSWSPYRVVTDVDGRNLCEPFLLRSPDGKELCCLMRENTRQDNSMMMFSQDEGQTWSKPQRTSWALTGDRHRGVQTRDGRWVIAFRDMAPGSATRGHFVAWTGSYDDIRNGRDCQYRIKLLHNYAGTDCGYPGIELLPDGTIVATTYVKYRPGKRRHSVVSTRFTLKEIDQKLREMNAAERQDGESRR